MNCTENVLNAARPDTEFISDQIKIIMQQESQIPKFILSIQNGYAQMPISYANLILGNKSNMYRLVSEEGWYLPNSESRCCTARYLFDVMAGTVFRIPVKDIRISLEQKRKLPKIDLICYLEQNLLNGQKFGFGPEKLPDRQWITNVLYTLDPQHEIFSGAKHAEKIVEIPIRSEYSLICSDSLKGLAF